MKLLGIGKMALWLRTLTVLPDDPSSISVLFTLAGSQLPVTAFPGAPTPLVSEGACAHIHIPTQTHVHH